MECVSAVSEAFPRLIWKSGHIDGEAASVGLMLSTHSGRTLGPAAVVSANVTFMYSGDWQLTWNWAIKPLAMIRANGTQCHDF